MKDSGGKPITQSLFLELGYSSLAIYTLKDDDYEYNGKFFYSLKKLYLEEEDPTEYIFANKYLLGIKHWLRICDNKQFTDIADEWRFELELKLRSQGIKAIIGAAKSGNQNASKWLSDKGWSDRSAGRPSKTDIEREKKIRMGMEDEFSEDLKRLQLVN